MDTSGLEPWHLAVNQIIVAQDAVLDVVVLTGNHANDLRAALQHLRTALQLLERCRERERLARNQVQAG